MRSATSPGQGDGVDREAATTSQPARTSAGTSARPMNPEAPVTSTRIMSDLERGFARVARQRWRLLRGAHATPARLPQFDEAKSMSCPPSGRVAVDHGSIMALHCRLQKEPSGWPAHEEAADTAKEEGAFGLLKRATSEGLQGAPLDDRRTGGRFPNRAEQSQRAGDRDSFAMPAPINAWTVATRIDWKNFNKNRCSAR